MQHHQCSSVSAARSILQQRQSAATSILQHQCSRHHCRSVLQHTLNIPAAAHVVTHRARCCVVHSVSHILAKGLVQNAAPPDGLQQLRHLRLPSSLLQEGVK